MTINGVSSGGGVFNPYPIIQSGSAQSGVIVNKGSVGKLPPAQAGNSWLKIDISDPVPTQAPVSGASGTWLKSVNSDPANAQAPLSAAVSLQSNNSVKQDHMPLPVQLTLGMGSVHRGPQGHHIIVGGGSNSGSSSQSGMVAFPLMARTPNQSVANLLAGQAASQDKDGDGDGS